MIPILFESNADNINTYGIGVLSDATSCEVTEERNGIYEMKMLYPVKGILYKELETERLILVKPNDMSDNQLFRIYRITTPINGIATIYAQHISYDLCNIAVTPFEDDNISPALAMNHIFSYNPEAHNFRGSTDFSDIKSFKVKTPQSIRACLGGVQGSMLDVWGGELEWDNYNVTLYSHRGEDNGVTIMYGKNLTDFEHDNDNTEAYTDVLPFAVYTDEEQVEHTITLPEVIIPVLDTQLTHQKTLIKDFTEFFESGNAISVDQLRGVATSYIANTILGFANPSVKISFEPLWNTPEYAAILEQVGLCDIVTVKHSELDISVKTKVITTVYDALNERYVSITLGVAKSNMINQINAVQREEEETKNKVNRFPSLMSSAIKNATDKITGQDGGYVVINSSAEKPYEILIMDTEDINTAVKVWRWNMSGLGYSSHGYAGPYETAITSDGEIVADFITTGTLVANIIKAGVLSSQDGSSWWDLETGEVSLSAYATNEIIDNITVTIEGVSDEISKVNEKTAELQTSIDGVNSFVSSLNETVETITDSLGNTEQDIIDLQKDYSELSQTIDGIRVEVGTQYSGGINFIQNSSGLNGLSDDWEYDGPVRTEATTDIKNNTASDSAFILGEYGELYQTITGLIPNTPYVFSCRAKKTASNYTSTVEADYGGSQYNYVINEKNSFGWTEFSKVIESAPNGTIDIIIYNRAGEFYIADMMLVEGRTPKKWTPAPNEIYTNEVKIDKRGIEVSNNQSSQRTVITNTEFAGYYNEEVIFTLNKDETLTKKTTVDGELTVGNVKFIPTGNEHGINIVVLD